MHLLSRGRLRPLLSSTRYLACYSTTSESSSPQPSINAKSLALLRTRVGKCIGFGLPAEQFERASAVLRVLATEWRGLLAGYEGFMVAKEKGGGWRRKVEWGDMVSSLI